MPRWCSLEGLTFPDSHFFRDASNFYVHNHQNYPPPHYALNGAGVEPPEINPGNFWQKYYELAELGASESMFSDAATPTALRDEAVLRGTILDLADRMSPEQLRQFADQMANTLEADARWSEGDIS
jgi:hypothetical protein